MGQVQAGIAVPTRAALQYGPVRRWCCRIGRRYVNSGCEPVLSVKMVVCAREDMCIAVACGACLPARKVCYV